MRILGIDPGSNCTGYGIIDKTRNHLTAADWGGIRCSPKQSFPERLKRIYDHLAGLIQEHQPDGVAVEDLFFANNAKSALKLGQTRGVILLAAAHCELEIFEYSPLEVKQSVAGYGRADKTQVRHMVTSILGMKTQPEPHDAADALALAVCHLHTHQTKMRLKSALKESK